MKLSIAEIEVENPTPEVDPEQLQGITDSFLEVGQSHPIIVRPANGKYLLVSGEKRLLAAIKLGWTEIESEIREVSLDDGKVIRLHENLRRFNLPWWEQVVLVEQLHLLRQGQHGVAPSGRPKQDEKQGWSLRDTAAELGSALGTLSEDLTLARALRNDPTLSKVKDKKTAIRLARIAVQRYESELEAGLAPKFGYDQVFFGDSASILKQLPPNSINHAITDPPWIRFFDNSLRLDDRTLPVFKELYRVMRFNSFVYIFCGLDDYDYYAGHTEPDKNNPAERVQVSGKLQDIGFNVSNTPIIWQKENSLTRRGVRAWEYDRDFEFIIVAAKGNPTLTTSRRLSGIKSFPIVPPVKMIHPNEKPLALIEDIITDCSYENEIIIDPFAGSGVLAEACIRTKRKYTLCERDKSSYDGILKRIEEARKEKK